MPILSEAQVVATYKRERQADRGRGRGRGRGRDRERERERETARETERERGGEREREREGEVFIQCSSITDVFHLSASDALGFVVFKPTNVSLTDSVKLAGFWVPRC